MVNATMCVTVALQKLTPECISRNSGSTKKTFAISFKYKTFDFN
jgi:hypothetical protein